MAEVGTLVLRLQAVTAQFEAKMSKTVQVLEKNRAGIVAIGAAAAGVTAALTLMAKGAVGMSSDFEAGMVRVAAVMDKATNEDLENLRKKALDVAATTKFTANEMAKGMQFFSMAGFDAATTMASIGPAAELAAAGAIDLGDAANITTSIMAGFGKTSEELTETNNILVRAITRAKVDVKGLGESFKTAGPVARAAGITFEETTAALALLGKAGIAGGDAGTGLKRSFVNLLAPSKNVKKILDDYNIVTKTATGGLTGIADILGQIERKGVKTGEVLEIFGQIAGPKMLALIGQGSDKLVEFTKNLSGGKTAAEIAEASMNTFSGQMLILNSVIEGTAIKFGDIMLPVLKAVVSVVIKLFTIFSNLPQPFKVIIVAIGALVAGLSGLITALSGVLVALPFVAMGIQAIGAIAPIVGAKIAAAFLPVTIIIAAVIFGIAAWIVIIGALKIAWKRNLGDIQGFIAKWKTEFTASFKLIGSAMGAVAGFFVRVWTGSLNIIGRIWDGIVSLIESGVNKLNELLEELINAFANTTLGKKLGFLKVDLGRVDFGGAKVGGEKGGLGGQTNALLGELFDSAKKAGGTIASALGAAWDEGLGIVGESASELKTTLASTGIDLSKLGGVARLTADELAALQEKELKKLRVGLSFLASQLEFEQAGERAQQIGAGGTGVLGRAAEGLGGSFAQAGEAVSRGAGIVEDVLTKTKVAAGPLIDTIRGILDVMRGFSPAIERALKAIDKMVAVLFDAFEPVFEVFEQVVGVVFEAVDAIAKFIGAIVGAIGPLLDFAGSILGVVGDIFGAIGDAFSDLADFISGVGERWDDILEGVEDSSKKWGSKMVEIFEEFANKGAKTRLAAERPEILKRALAQARLKLEAAQADFLSVRAQGQSGERARKNVERLSDVVAGITDELASLEASMRESALPAALDLRARQLIANFDNLAIPVSIVDQVARSMGISLEEMADAITGAGGVIDGMDTLGDTMARVNQELTSVPAGFKTALRRFQSTDVGGSAGTSSITAPGERLAGTSAGITIEQMTVVTPNVDDFVHQVEEEASWARVVRTGTPVLTAPVFAGARASKGRV